jgi:RNA polymerase sigma-70 factor (ECF subfamily)
MRSGNPTFDDILAYYKDEIYRYALRLTRTRAEADGLYQETLREAHRAFDTLDGSAHHNAWLFTLATNAFLRAHHRCSWDSSRDEELADACPVAPRSHTARPGTRDLVSDVEASVAALPRAEWVALVQRTYYDRSYTEIAGSLGCSATAAQASVYTALRTLRAHVGDRL